MNYGKDSIKQRRKELKSKGRKRLSWLRVTLVHLVVAALIGLMILGVSTVWGVFKGIIATAPDIGNIDVTPSGFSTFVYDTDGNQIAKLVSTDSNRIPVTMDMIPTDMQHAFVAIEDERFYTHSGVDIQGIFRAAWNAVSSGDLSQGASTITQQLIKNNVFTGWTNETRMESIKRKIQEQYLAVELEKTMSKDDILLNYLNTINLGHNTLGVQAASLRYFGKSVSDLTLSESSVIASITQNPTRYDPITNPENNMRRREEVLNHMLDQGYIDQAAYDAAMADDVYSRISLVDTQTDDEEINSYFVDALTNQLLEDFIAAGYTETQAYHLLYSGGLSIYSTQDSGIQKIVDYVVTDPANFPAQTNWYLNYALTVEADDGSLSNYSTEMMELWSREQNPAFSLIFPSQEAAQEAVETYKNYVLSSGGSVYDERMTLTAQPQISLTIEDQATGNVVAMIGGRGEKTGNRTLNRATDSPRQPGSTFKVVAAYAPALDAAGMTLADTQDDAPFTFEDGTPCRNWYGESYRGITTLRVGIQDSMNIIAVKTLSDITPALGFDYLLRFGFTTLVDQQEIGGRIYSDIQQTLALGGLTKGVTNYELNAAYATIANGGTYIEPKLYSKVVDHSGNVILDASANRQERRVLKETTAWLLTSAMQDVVTKGTGTAVNFGTTAIAGKTGTTNAYNDVWFAGYTPNYTCTCWAGYDENTKLSSSEEKNLAKTIWRRVMEQIPANLNASTFSMPPGIVQQTVCSMSGKLPVEGLCNATLLTEYFAADTLPAEHCDVHFQGTVCAYSGLPASDSCPFKTTGVLVLSPDNTGETCQHTAEFMAREDAGAIIDQQRLELQLRQTGVTLEDATNALHQAADLLAATQAQLVEAQQSGDPEAIALAQAQVETATENYNFALAAQAAAAAAAAGAGQ